MGWNIKENPSGGSQITAFYLHMTPVLHSSFSLNSSSTMPTCAGTGARK